MGETASLKKVMMDSTSLAQRGAYDQALIVLKEAIEGIGESDPADSVVILFRHAAIISLGTGNLTAAENCIRTSVARFPNDPFSLYLMAEVLERKREYADARFFASRSLEEALKHRSARYEAISEIVVHRWPDLKGCGPDAGESEHNP
jgi:tetratricopeptide (TPR) repeat protein